MTTMPGIPVQLAARRLLGPSIAVLLFVAGMLSLFRYVWMPGPYRSLGDDNDGMILVATLEHWWRVMHGTAIDWRTPGWFWPTRDTLGLTDTYALFALPYAGARAGGFGMFRAFDLAVGAFATAGYWGFVWLMRRFDVRWGMAASFGFVFAFGSMVTMKLGHAQTYTIMLAPVMALLLVAAWRRRGWRSATLAALAGLWFGVMTLTAPQTGWFLAMDGMITAGILVVLTPVSQWVANGTRLAVLAGGGAVGAGLGLLPVVAVYGGTITHNRRSWGAVLEFLPRLTDLANVEPGNILWYDILYRIGVSQSQGRQTAEAALGFTPGVLLAALVGLAIGVPRLLAWRRAPRGWDALALSCLLTPFAAWLLTADIAGHSIWYGVWRLVPGGDGVRTPFRIQLASLFLLCAGASTMLSRRIDAGSRWSRLSLPLLACLCVVEQATTGLSTHDEQAANRWLDAASHPPAGCQAFYLLPSTAEPAMFWMTQQSEAMLLSQVTGLPTVNGNSSYLPAGWDLLEPNSPGYGGRVSEWARTHPVGALCGVEPQQGRWSVDGSPANRHPGP